MSSFENVNVNTQVTMHRSQICPCHRLTTLSSRLHWTKRHGFGTCVLQNVLVILTSLSQQCARLIRRDFYSLLESEVTQSSCSTWGRTGKVHSLRFDCQKEEMRGRSGPHWSSVPKGSASSLIRQVPSCTWLVHFREICILNCKVSKLTYS